MSRHGNCPIIIIINNNDTIYGVLNLVKNDHSMRATHMEQGMYNHVQKAGGDRVRGRVKSLLLREVSFQVSFESV